MAGGALGNERGGAVPDDAATPGSGGGGGRGRGGGAAAAATPGGGGGGGGSSSGTSCSAPGTATSAAGTWAGGWCIISCPRDGAIPGISGAHCVEDAAGTRKPVELAEFAGAGVGGVDAGGGGGGGTGAASRNNDDAQSVVVSDTTYQSVVFGSWYSFRPDWSSGKYSDLFARELWT